MPHDARRLVGNSRPQLQRGDPLSFLYPQPRLPQIFGLINLAVRRQQLFLRQGRNIGRKHAPLHLQLPQQGDAVVAQLFESILVQQRMRHLTTDDGEQCGREIGLALEARQKR